MAAKAIVYLVSLHILSATSRHSSEALVSTPTLSFYADNRLDQTIAYKYLPSRERKGLQHEILNLLGLHHRPKPKSHGKSDQWPPAKCLALFAPQNECIAFRVWNLLNSLTGSRREQGLRIRRQSIWSICTGRYWTERAAAWWPRIGRRSSSKAKPSAIIVCTQSTTQTLSWVSPTRVSRSSKMPFTFTSNCFPIDFLVHKKAPHLRHDRDRRFWFDVSEVSPEDNLMDAELRLYRDLSESLLPLNITYRLSLYQLSQGDDPELV